MLRGVRSGDSPFRERVNDFCFGLRVTTRGMLKCSNPRCKKSKRADDGYKQCEECRVAKVERTQRLELKKRLGQHQPRVGVGGKSGVVPLGKVRCSQCRNVFDKCSYSTCTTCRNKSKRSSHKVYKNIKIDREVGRTVDCLIELLEAMEAANRDFLETLFI